MSADSLKILKTASRRNLLTSVTEVSEFHNHDKMFLISTVTPCNRRNTLTCKEAEDLIEIKRRHFRMSRFPVIFSSGYEIQARR